MRHTLLILGLLVCNGCSASTHSYGGGTDGGTSSPGEAPDSSPTARVHARGSDPTTGTVDMDFTGSGDGTSDGVHCEYWNVSGSIPPHLHVTAQKGISDLRVDWWNMRLYDGQSRTESFTSTKKSMEMNVTLLEGGEFRYRDPYEPSMGNCRSALTVFTSERIAGSLTCSPLPGEKVDSSATLSLTFDCPLVYHPAS